MSTSYQLVSSRVTSQENFNIGKIVEQEKNRHVRLNDPSSARLNKTTHTYTRASLAQCSLPESKQIVGEGYYSDDGMLVVAQFNTRPPSTIHDTKTKNHLILHSSSSACLPALSTRGIVLAPVIARSPGFPVFSNAVVGELSQSPMIS